MSFLSGHWEGQVHQNYYDNNSLRFIGEGGENFGGILRPQDFGEDRRFQRIVCVQLVISAKSIISQYLLVSVN